MPFVVRVKRHIDEEHLNYKKRRIDDQQEKKEVSTIHRFSSIKSPDEKITSKIKKRKSKEDAKDRMSKIRSPDISSRNRQEILLKTHSNRLLVSNCSRTLTEIEEKEETSNQRHPADEYVVPDETAIVDPVESLLRFVVMFEEMYVSMKII